MRALIALIVIVYLVGVGVALAPCDSGQVEHRFSVRPRHRRWGGSAQCTGVASEGLPQHNRQGLIAPSGRAAEVLSARRRKSWARGICLRGRAARTGKGRQVPHPPSRLPCADRSAISQPADLSGFRLLGWDRPAADDVYSGALENSSWARSEERDRAPRCWTRGGGAIRPRRTYVEFGPGVQ